MIIITKNMKNTLKNLQRYKKFFERCFYSHTNNIFAAHQVLNEAL